MERKECITVKITDSIKLPNFVEHIIQVFSIKQQTHLNFIFDHETKILNFFTNISETLDIEYIYDIYEQRRIKIKKLLEDGNTQN